jgi:hypothetical protein
MANLTPTYRRRYHYYGSMNIGLIRNKQNFKGDPDFSVNKAFNISWNHSMDSKAKPGTNFGANVNFGSQKYNSYISDNPIRNVTNVQQSSINYSKTWTGTTPMNFTMTANENQNSVSHIINLTLPDAGFNISTFYPFQRKEVIGSPKWYEKIGLGYTVSARNQLSFNDTVSNTIGSLLDTLEWGAQHRFRISL